MKSITKQRIIYMIGDFIAVAAGVLFFNLFRHWRIYHGLGLSFEEWNHDPHVLCGYVVFPIMMLMIYGVLGFYKEPFYKSRYEAVSNSMLSTIIGTLIIYFAIAVNDDFNGRSFHYSLIVGLFISLFIPVIFERWLVGILLKRGMKEGKNTYNVLVVGPVADAEKFADRLRKSNAKIGFNVVGVADENCENLQPFIDEFGVKAFVAVPTDGNPNHGVELVNKLYGYGLSIFLPLSYHSLLTSRPKLHNVIGEPLVDVTAPGMSNAAMNLKRIGDIMISFFALIVLLPVYAILSIWVKLDSKGPAFYCQERVGLHRKKFKIIKFRTMIVDAEPDGPALSSADDKRVTRLGHFLRKYRIDEIPQFWNVLRGDMSLVGPRPEREYFLKILMKSTPAVCTLHNVRPGLISLGTVKFGYAGTVEEMTKRLYYELLYVENMSFSLDLKVLFHAVNTVLTGKGV